MLAMDAALWWAGFSWQGPSDEPPLRVAFGVWPGTETLILARERGALEKSGIHLMEMTWPTASIRALANRSVDAAVLSLAQVLELSEMGHEVTAVLAMDVSQGADVIVASPHVHSLNALKRLRVGVEAGSTGMYLLARALGTCGLHLSDVEIIPLNAAEMRGAYQQHDVDAVVASEPWATLLRNDGAVLLFDSSQTSGEICRFLVCRQEGLDRRRVAVERLVSLHLKMIPHLHDDEEAVGMKAVMRREELQSGEFRRALGRIELLGRDETVRLFGGEHPGISAVADRVAAFMQTSGLLTRRVNRRPWFTDKIVKQKP